MKYHYVWLGWASAFLLPWLAPYIATVFRPVMWRVSVVTAVFGLTEPIFVPEYWNPPSLFELASTNTVSRFQGQLNAERWALARRLGESTVITNRS